MAAEKNNKTLNVPNLRFPEFSGEWERCTIGDITRNYSLRNKDKIQYPMFSVTNSRGFVPQSEQFEDREMIGEDIKAYKIIHEGDFAYNPARINVGSIAKYDKSEPCMISSLYVCFKALPQINNEWLMQLLKTPKMNFYYNVNGEGGVRVYLFYPNFARIRTSYPSLAEQQKIASFLSLLDQRIETQRKIIEKYESLIRGLYQLLFQNAKYNDFISLGDISQISNGNSDVKDASMNNDGSLYPFFDRSDEIKFLPEYLFDKEAIIYPGEGAEFYPRYYNGKFALHQRCYAIYDISTDFIPRYLYHYCKTQNSYFVRNAVGSTVASLRLDTFKRLQIPAIPTHHQELLVMFLDKIEAKIECNRTILKKYEDQKKYLLSTLFI
ncbi:MAG: restriction endonuclease subunit S [Bacteroidales bacterium]|nr:restriction endonuclease subunit S [Bacteroidales bacterium]